MFHAVKPCCPKKGGGRLFAQRGAGSAGKSGKNLIFAVRGDAFGRSSCKELYWKLKNERDEKLPSFLPALPDAFVHGCPG